MRGGGLGQEHPHHYTLSYNPCVQGGQKYSSRCDRGAGSGLPQCGFFLLKGIIVNPSHIRGFSEQRGCSGTYTITAEERKTLTQGMSLEKPS